MGHSATAQEPDVAAPAGRTLTLLHGALRLPTYMPDATLGVVRAVDAADLEAAGVDALVMNVFHLMQRPGSSTVGALGNLHRMAGWRRPIITDSGGFQAYSLIRENPKFGSISDRGIAFQPENADRKFQLTPEKSVQLQLSYGADVVICLDDCTHVDDPFDQQQTSVRRTIAWARRCKAEFSRQTTARRGPGERLLFGVVQGGGYPALRRECAEALLEVGFDGFGYGGWPFDSKGSLLTEMLAYTRSLIPHHLPLHALGVGHPRHIVTCARLGYDLFDSALPTRDARGGRLYQFTTDPHGPGFQLAGDWFDTLYIEDRKHIKTDRPVFSGCDCHTCQRYAVGYLHHLQTINDTLYYRLATIHNLRFMMTLIGLLRSEVREG